MKDPQKENAQIFNESEFISFADTLNRRGKEVAVRALSEIEHLKNELEAEREYSQNCMSIVKELEDELEMQQYRMKETMRFLKGWAEGFAKLIKSSGNMADDGHLRHHYFAIRESAKNLVLSCRGKLNDLDFINAQTEAKKMKRRGKKRG